MVLAPDEHARFRLPLIQVIEPEAMQRHRVRMARFYFDYKDGNHSVLDDDGLEFATLLLAEQEATAALSEIARDALPGTEGRELAIEVSDESRSLLFRAVFWLEVQALNSSHQLESTGDAERRSEADRFGDVARC